MATGLHFAWDEITIDPLLEAGYDGREVLSDTRKARIVRATALRQAGVRVSARRGSQRLGGALGAEFLPDQAGQLLVIALVSSSEQPPPHEDAFPGLPRSLARRVMQTAMTTDEIEALGSGVLRFDRALLYPGRSTMALFEWLASAVVKLLIPGLELLPEAELAALLGVSYEATTQPPDPLPDPLPAAGEATALSAKLLARLAGEQTAVTAQAGHPEPNLPLQADEALLEEEPAPAGAELDSVPDVPYEANPPVPDEPIQPDGINVQDELGETPDWLSAAEVFGEEDPAGEAAGVALSEAAEAPLEPDQAQAQAEPEPESGPVSKQDDEAGADDDGGPWRDALQQERYHFPPPARTRYRDGDPELWYLCAACGRYGAREIEPGLYQCTRCQAVVEYQMDEPSG